MEGECAAFGIEVHVVLRPEVLNTDSRESLQFNQLGHFYNHDNSAILLGTAKLKGA